MQDETKNIAITIAIKNEGAEMPMTLAKTEVVSSQVFCFTAATMPRKIPKITAKNIAAQASKMVPGNASINTSVTGFFV